MSKRPPTKKTGKPSRSFRIILLSDGTGETAHQMVKAAMVQFKHKGVAYTRYKSVHSDEQIDAICRDAEKNESLIVYTIVSPKLRQFLVKTTTKKQIPAVDILSPLLIGLAKYFDDQPIFRSGLLHKVNDDYFRRIEAMEYTIAHDDGRDLTKLDQADLVILGISRTSKTPISMYLGHQGWKVANVPLIRGYNVPPEIFTLDQRRVVALMIDPEELAQIRRNRLQRLGSRQGGDYADIQRVTEEIEFVNDIFRKNRKWAVFNVTGKALEETAFEIVKLMESRKLLPASLAQT